MMNYEDFKEVVATTFKTFLSDEYQDMKVLIEPVTKVNVVLDGLKLTDYSQDDIIVSPTVYINEMYEKYQKTGDLSFVFTTTARLVERALAEKPVIPDFAEMKNKIVFQLVNTAQNKTLLKDLPHRKFLDLSVIYRVVIEEDKNGMKSSVVRHDLARTLGLTEEKLFALAMENTRKMFPTVVRNLSEVLREMMIEDGMPPELANMMFSDDQPDGCPTLFIISNTSKMYGAAVILYEDVLRELAGRFDSDLYILPSSIHEVMAVPIVDDMQTPEELSEMVTSINTEQVDIEDRLSNLVYRYDKASGKIVIA